MLLPKPPRELPFELLRLELLRSLLLSLLRVAVTLP
jgi:hypothetical protein